MFEALIQKLEAAVEWDEQLDREIEEQIDSDGRRLGWGPYPYTSKIDAARGLLDRVLPGWSYRVARCAVSDDAWVIPDFNCPVHGERLRTELRQDIDWSDLTDVDLRPSGREATALCISILKALEIINAQSHQAAKAAPAEAGAKARPNGEASAPAEIGADGERAQQEDETLVVDLRSMPDKWPPVKKALWDVVMTAELNGGKYVNAWDFTEKLFAAVQTATINLQQSPVAEVLDRQNGFVFSIFPEAFHRIHIGDLLYTAPQQPTPSLAVKGAVDRLKEALMPFAKEAENWHESVPDSHRSLCTEPEATTAHPGSETAFTVGDLRRAREVYSALSAQAHDVVETTAADLDEMSLRAVEAIFATLFQRNLRLAHGANRGLPDALTELQETQIKAAWQILVRETLRRGVSAQAKDMSGWLPIGTVEPTDGMIVMGWGEYRERDGFSPAFMRWSEFVGGWAVNALPFYPTHWMPLPAAPARQDGT